MDNAFDTMRAAMSEARQTMVAADQLTHREVDKMKDQINALRDYAHEQSHRAGWWYHAATGTDIKQILYDPSGPIATLLSGALVGQKLALIHSEISEAMEGHRKGLQDDKLPHRPMIEVELADAVIRIMDLAGAMGLDIGGAIMEKMEFNAHRPDHKPDARAAAGGKAY